MRKERGGSSFLNKNPVSRLNEEIKVHYPNTSMQNSEEYPQERKI